VLTFFFVTFAAFCSISFLLDVRMPEIPFHVSTWTNR
jgi:hypothetical protein